MKPRALWLVSLLALASASHAGPRADGAPPATLPEAERELAALEQRLGEGEARLGKLTADIALRDRRSGARARAYVRMARAGLLPVAGGFDALVDHAMKLEGVRRSLSTDLSALTQLRGEHRALVASRDRLAARRAVVAAQRDALAQAAQLIAEADERRRAFDAAFVQRESSPASRVAVYGAGITVRDAAPDPSGFAGQKGRLPFPISGRVEATPARRKSASGPGVELRAPLGAAVRAVFAGRVAFSARYGDYGRIVILDHGGGYFTVSGNLGQVDVKVGDELSAGARLGAVGDDGAGPMLYFEVRQGQETLDPKAWLGVG